MYLFLPYFSENNYIYTQAEFQAKQKGYNTVKIEEFKEKINFYALKKRFNDVYQLKNARTFKSKNDTLIQYEPLNQEKICKNKTKNFR